MKGTLMDLPVFWVWKAYLLFCHLSFCLRGKKERIEKERKFCQCLWKWKGFFSIENKSSGCQEFVEVKWADQRSQTADQGVQHHSFLWSFARRFTGTCKHTCTYTHMHSFFFLPHELTKMNSLLSTFLWVAGIKLSLSILQGKYLYSLSHLSSHISSFWMQLRIYC